MPFDQLTALLVLAVTAAFTPGPNNALVASSGAHFGYRRTLPHVLGIALGFGLMVLCIALFLGELFQRSALLRETLRWAGAALLLYVAYKIATAGGLSGDKGRPRPFTFLEAAGFQWINPKAWAMAIAVSTQFVTPVQPVLTAIIIAGIFCIAGIASASTWTVLGVGLGRFLSTERRLRVFNLTMGLLIAACVILLFLD